MSDFVPAAGRRWLTPAYDRALALTMREDTFRSRLLGRVVADDPRHVLEIGCGTGSLTVRAAAALPDAVITGLDPDPDALHRARRKDPVGAVTWVEGTATALPFEDSSMDAVIASLVLHHLDTQAKQRALSEAHRVLRPGGRLHLADWGRPSDPLMWAAFTALRTLDGFEPTRAHAAGLLPALVASEGFTAVRRHDRLRTAWGTLELLTADGRRQTGGRSRAAPSASGPGGPGRPDERASRGGRGARS